jgi:hypothetical protein
MIRAADAPSVSGEEFPGVIRQSSAGNRAAASVETNDGFNVLSASALVPARIVSSVTWSVYPLSGSPVGIATISVANDPAAAAAAARWCEVTANASRASRSIFHRAATSSAATPCLTRPCG